MTIKRDKIAIVGMACRFPGESNSPTAYWEVLKNGKDVVTEIPNERWDRDYYQHANKKEPGKSYTFAAGVINHVDEFDAGFFGISRREAEQMDPQQRLLLELTWEALENGGQVPKQLVGTNCAVYIGVAGTDYVNRRVDDPSSMDPYSMTGGTLSIASNRISYWFDFRGPSVSVDTACSSSLVALHQACQSIWSGEADMAITGGINLLLHPFGFVGFSKATMLSPEGRCQTFDANGDGYVRAEGAAIVYLKPLAQAEADGDPIHAVIVASGINCDGHTHGMTVPSPEQQGELLQRIYQQAGLDFDDITYVEAHGTGTAVGDPLETRALGEIIGKARRKDNPLRIGSAKSNVGHLETASGMAGLFKAILCLQHRALPASLHVKTLNPRIDFAELNLSVVTEFTPLAVPAHATLRIGVNSFGFGGANAHVLLESYNAEAATPALPIMPASIAQQTVLPPLYLSAKSAAALTAQAQQYADWLLQQTPEQYPAIAWSCFQHRQALPHGLVIYQQTNVDEVIQALQDFALNEDAKIGMAKGQLAQTDKQPVLVFSGNGSQWQGMGRNLFASNATFRQTIEQVATLFAAYTDYDLRAAFAEAMEDTPLALTEIAQPVLFAFQVGVMSVLQAVGLQASAVVGHSVGEVAAAWAAGALSLPQAVKVIYQRSFAQSQTRGMGRMAAVSLSKSEALELIQTLNLENSVEIAGVNSPKAVTLAGDLAGLEQLGSNLSERGIFYRLLDLDYAFHSRHMDGIQDTIHATLADLTPQDTTHCAFVSTVTGDYLAGTALDADYWWRNIREPVAFGDAISRLIDNGARVFIEIGPHPILRSYVNDGLQAANVIGTLLKTIRRKDEKADYLHKAAYGALLAGCALDLSVHFPTPLTYTRLPTYPWQRERYWLAQTNEGYDLVRRHREHPLLGYRLKEAEAGWENQLDTSVLPYLADHIVDNAVVIPAAAYAEMALAASVLWFKTPSHCVEQLDIRAPIVLNEDCAKTIRFTLQPTDGSFTITSRDRLSDAPWTLNVSGRLLGATYKTEPHALDIATLQQADCIISGAEHYALTAQVGLTYQAAFQGVQQVWTDQQSYALAQLTQANSIQARFSAHHLHPVLLDAGFQTLVDIFQQDLATGQRAALIPIQIGKLHYYRALGVGEISYVHVAIQKRSPRSVVAHFTLVNAQGECLALLENCRFRGVQLGRQRQQQLPTYTFQAIPLTIPTAANTSIDITRLQAAATTFWQNQEPILQREHYFQHIQPLLDILVSSFAWETLQRLTANPNLQSCTVDTLMEQQQIAAQYRPLLLALWELLANDELAVCTEDGQWTLQPNTDLPDAKAIWLAILGDSSASLAELVRLGRCGTHLMAVLRGEMTAQALLYPEKSSVLDHWQDVSPSYRAMNGAVQASIRQLCQTWPAQRRLRILEISQHNSALVRLLLPELPALQCDYVYADFNAEYSDWVAENFSDYSALTALTLKPDLSGDTYQQLLEQPVDVVILNNVLHRLEDVPNTLTRLKALCQPGGLLLAVEPSADRYSLLTAGLEPNWWLWDETTQQHHASQLSAPQWSGLLQNQGFTNVSHHFELNDLLETGAYVLWANIPARQTALTPTKSIQPTQDWLIIHAGVDNVTLELLSAKLQAQQQQVHLVADSAAAVSYLQQHNIQHIVYLPAPQANCAVSMQHDYATQRCTETLHLVQALNRQDSESRPQLWLVTSGAIAHPTADNAMHLNPAAAPLWGMGRVLMNEHPDLRPTLIDITHTLTPEQYATVLSSELLNNDAEDEILLGVDYRYGLRMQATALPTNSTTPDVALDFTSPGLLKNLYWRALPPQTLAADEVEIKPYASGLNFRDVMYAMGLLSDEAVENGFAGASLGMEFAGVITRIGSTVTDFKVGDAVMGFAPACFSTRIITQTTAVTHKPAAWSYEEASTIPATFFTVYYALHHLAQLEPGEKILIHGASGGVGLAAIQFARYRGAEIFATAGTDEKRDFVKLAGADHVLDSRSLQFADDILALTAGKGVDVVLNSISGEAINRNLAILKPFGRFLELGKRDFYENSKIGLRPFRNNISYFGIDADQLLIERPALAKRLFQDMFGLFNAGVLRPLPYRVFPTSRMVEAFRYMQQSRQIGKVIVSFQAETPTPTYPTATDALQLDAHATYLITGGLSGFGAETARWLAALGAKSLVLVSRSGTATPDAAKIINELRAQGVLITELACDVTQNIAVTKLLANIAANLPPLKGIVHAAMVLDDGIVRNLTPERFQTVLAPKVLGAWNLHQQTQSLVLDFFIMYSSATTYLGNPGQANYVAANLFLENLAHYRQALGLPATYAAWGAIGDAGYLTHNQAIKDALQSRLGGEPLQAHQALNTLTKVLQSQLPGAAIIEFDWKVIQRVMPAALSPKYHEQQRQVAHLLGDEQNGDLLSVIKGMSAVEAQKLIANALLEEIGKILRLPTEKLAIDKPIFELGMDSLMGMELILAVEEKFGIRLPVMALTEGTNVQKIAERITQQLFNNTNENTTTNPIDMQRELIATTASKHGYELSNEELEHLTSQLVTD